MRYIRKFKNPGPAAASILALCLALGAGTALAGTIVVAPGGTLQGPPNCPADPYYLTNGHMAFSSIQDAADCAADGDVVEIYPGTYTEQILIDKDLALKGSGPGATLIHSPAVLVPQLTIGSHDIHPVIYVSNDAEVVIEDLTVDGLKLGLNNNYMAGILYHNAAGTVEGCVVTGIREDAFAGVIGLAVYARNEDAAAREFHVLDCDVNDYSKQGISAAGEGLQAWIHDNVVTGIAGREIAPNGIYVAPGVWAEVYGNTITDNVCGAASCGPDVYNDYQGAGILLIDTAAGTMVHNNVCHNNDSGIYAYGSSNLLDNILTGNIYTGIICETGTHAVQGNHIISTVTGSDGVWVVGSDLACTADIDGCCLDGDMSSGSVGVWASTPSGGPGAVADVSNCQIWSWENGLMTDGDVALNADHNSIMRNTAAGYDNTGSSNTQLAEMNWWGDPAGPGPVAGDRNPVVGAGVDYDPWLLSGADLDGGCPFIPASDNTVYAEGPEDCLTDPGACVWVPVRIARADNVGMRGYSVQFDLVDLELCPGENIIQGNYLSSVNNTNFQVTGSGPWTVDCAILGLPCGADDPMGTLFTIPVKRASTDGTGYVQVASVILRDCQNQPISGAPGADAEIVIDTEAPAAVADLTAAQVLQFNAADGRTDIELTFSLPGDADSVEVWRAPFGTGDAAGAYPEYDDVAGAAAPVPAAYPPGLPWIKTMVTAGGQTDQPPARGYWYYVVYTWDACGNVSSASNMTSGTLNYHLGDTHNGSADCSGDNQVNMSDITFLGSNYGIVLNDPPPDAYACLDVGPTADYSVNTLPTTDNLIGFEDLMMFAINFGQVSLGGPPPTGDLAWLKERPVLSMRLHDQGGTLEAHLLLQGNNESVKGIHALVGYDQEELRLLGVDSGDLLNTHQGIFFMPLETGEGTAVDAAILGHDAALHGSGQVAVLRFEVLRRGAQPRLLTADLRDRRNLRPGQQPSGQTGEDPETADAPSVQAPAVIELLGARPNPFSGSTEIVFRLPEPGNVQLQIFDINGRLVRTLAGGSFPAGTHSVSWNGTTDEGQKAGIGVYFYTFRSGELSQSRKLYLYR